MRYVINYYRKNLQWISLYLLLLFMMNLILYLNQADISEMIYSSCVLLFIFIVVSVAGSYKYYVKNKKLEYLIKTMKNSKKQLEQIHINYELFPEAYEVIEMQYQEIVSMVNDDKFEYINATESRYQDLMQYYSLWVHQIKTPIAAMRLLLQSVEDESFYNQAKELEEELFAIEQYVEMALQYVRLDSVTNDFVLQPENIADIAKEAIRKYAKLFIRKKIRINFDENSFKVGEEDWYQAITDRKWMVFVIEQILSNAIKYTKTGSVSVYMEKADINASEDSPNIYLVIEDTGIGIKGEDLPRVCEKGYTGYNGHGDNRSTGIGLYMCKRILAKLSHTIEITSEVGVGTKVRIGV